MTKAVKRPRAFVERARIAACAGAFEPIYPANFSP
jgi:hypothetical protein